MKKIKRIWNRTEKRVVALLLAMLFVLTAIFSSMSMAGFVMSTFAHAEETDSNLEIEIDGEKSKIRDDALHFIFRHWHTDWDPEATMQSSGAASGSTQFDTDMRRYFVIVEGYIIPHTQAELKEEVPGNNYTIVLVNQQDGSLTMARELYNDYSSNLSPENGKIVLSQPKTPYLGKLDKTMGSIELKVKKLRDVYTVNGQLVYDPTETFCGVSLSAGRSASSIDDKDGDDETDTITITYNKVEQTHIVKGHIFYNDRVKTVSGTRDIRLVNDQTDIAKAYTWIKGGNHAGIDYAAGDLVEYTGEEGSYELTKGLGNVVSEGDEDILDELGLKIGTDVFLKTFYSSTVGLHTNKTLMQSADGRFFLFDLEAWYIEGTAAQLGYVIDASGSMAFTSDVPSVLNIYTALANRLGVYFDSPSGNYTYEHVLFELNDDGSVKLDENGIPIRQKNSSGKLAAHKHTYHTCSDIIETTQRDENNNEVEVRYYDPSDKEKQDDMRKFILEDFFKNDSREVICALITETLGDGYELTPEMLQEISGKRGMPGGFDALRYRYPQRENMIGYYEITQNSGSVGNISTYRRWYYNSIDIVPASNTEICQYIAPSTTYTGDNSYAEGAYFARAVNPRKSYEDITSGKFDFSKSAPIINAGDFSNVGITDNLTWSGYAYFNGTNSSMSFGGNGAGNSGFMLSPSSTPTGDFTLSFDALLTSWQSGRNIEVLYIGAESGDDIAEAEFRLVREAGNNNDLVLHYGSKKQTLIENFAPTKKQTLTFTYDKSLETVKFYVNGEITATVNDVKFASDEYIVFNPFNNYLSSGRASSTFNVDEIIVYNTALSMSEVRALHLLHGVTGYQKGGVDFTTAENFLTDWELLLFLSPQNTAHVSLGVAAYNYFVLDNTYDYSPLAYWDGQNANTVTNASGTFAHMANGTVLGALDNYENISGAGWYFLSHSSDWANLQYAGTDKKLSALAGNSEFDLDKQYSYTATEGETIRFYIDDEGNLRCFYSSSVDKIKCSFVYELPDDKYVKTEALQRILAYLSAEISQQTPSSQIAATQFSNENRTSENLVLLDWTSNSDEFAAIMSQKYGEPIEKGEKDKDYGGDPGAANGWTLSSNTKTNDPLKQYNFALTGATYTYSGLQSFLDNIVLTASGYNKLYGSARNSARDFKSNNKVPELTSSKLKEKTFLATLEEIAKDKNGEYRRDDADAPKFVIVFTDGADSSFDFEKKDKDGNIVLDQDHKSKVYAEILKKLGYTVIGVYIPNGGDPRDRYGNLEEQEGGSKTQWGQAQAFLSTIADKSEDGKPYVFASTDINTVSTIFSSKIMASIHNDMSGYTVQEYIDPRFDLQKEDGTIWHLGAGGNVTIDSVVTYAYVFDADGKPILDKDGKPIIQKDANGNDMFATITIEYSDGRTYHYPADGSTYELRPLKEGLGVTFQLAGENTNGNARKPRLRYDPVRDMYYLIWENQKIQSNPEGMDEMLEIEIWSAQYWLVAKDDFIGGNAVLTSGNEKNMNYVYHFADRSEDGYATYVLNSWNAVSSTKKNTTVSDWNQLRTADALSGYKSAWAALTAEEQKALTTAWTSGAASAWDDVCTRLEKTVPFDGTFVMYVISDLSLKRTNIYDANSGTSDMKKTSLDDPDAGTVEAANGQPVPVVDDFPSKGFPRIAVNVSPNAVYEAKLISTVYLGEVMSSVLVLNNMVNNNYDNAYLNYLARYAYYKYPNEPTPLLKLLEKWDGIDATEDVDGKEIKSFSVPYMYLPNYQYNTNGDVIPVKLNNAGVSREHSEDVLGLLTYHWKLIEGDADVKPSVVNDVDDMDPWKNMKYELTVEYTVFREGDDYDTVRDACNDVTIFDAELIDGTKFESFKYNRSAYLEDLVTEKNVYAAKVWAVGTKDTANEADAGNSEESDEGSVDKNMVTVAALMQLMDVDEEKAEEIVSARIDNFYNDDRTQQVVFKYQPNVVGAELALELQITAKEEEWKSLALSSKTITVTATRTFTDNAYAEKLKKGKVDGVSALADYDNTKFTIEFSITKPADATPDNGVYTVYAKAKVKGTFGDGSEKTLSALPIGNYKFGSDAVDTSDIPRLTMSSPLGFEKDVNKFNANYFNINSDLFGTNDNPNDVSGNIAYSSGDTIYFGTKMNNTTNYTTRNSNGGDWIRDHDSLIAIIDISAGVSPVVPYAKIVIAERGGSANESFLYGITDGNGNELIVSVRGGGSTTIYVPFGTYTVKEISDWSWRYEDGAAQATRGKWTISQSNAKIAETEVNTSETRIVTYFHEPNYKGWLGGENYKDFFFGDSHE